MRRSLTVRALIVSVLIVIVFSVPLGILLARQASERAMTLASSDSRALAPIVSLAGDPRVSGALTRVAQLAEPRQVSVIFPDGSLLRGNEALEADPLTDPKLLARARAGESFSQTTKGGEFLYVPVSRTNKTVAVITVFVPTGELRRNVARNWLFLALLGMGLVGLAVLVSDRLGRSVVRSVGQLDDTARALARGQLDARIEPSGPPEVAQVGAALNLLGSRIDELIMLERATVADLSHRLRTPVTALRAEAAQVQDDEARPRLERGIDELTRTIDEIIREAQRPVRSGLGVAADLGSVARSRGEFWAVLAEDQGRLFTIDVAEGVHPVAVIESDLAAVVDALLDNVFSHTPETSDFRLRVRTIADEVELVIDDSGPGVPEGFDPERGSSAAGSTGLGLDIVRKTVESCGGVLALRNRARGGTRVRATFPRVGDRHEPLVR
jgi:signal transduction histidine kinase